MIEIFKILIVSIVIIPAHSFSQMNTKYIVVDYTSICCGTPSEKPIMDYIIKFEKDHKLEAFEMFVEHGLGKEGEHTFYIGTDNLKNKWIKSFLNGLKDTATIQNKQRSNNSDGYVIVKDEFITNASLKNIKDHPRTKMSSLEAYDYKT